VEGSNPYHYHDLREAVRIFAGDSLAFEPGTRFRYTNVGFLLLGCVVEGVAGRRYEELLRELVLAPAQMRRTQPNDAWTVIPNRAQAYQGRTAGNANFWWWTRGQKAELVVDSIFNARFEDTSIKLSAGGLLATPADLVRLGSALIAGRVLRPSTRDTMWTPQLTTTGDSTGWALGWSPGLDSGRRTIGLRGGQAGVSAVLRVYRDDDLVIAAVANRDLVNLGPLVSALAHLWL
jgi:CubicO group peptidase (beta-lactamase class C family)